MKYVYILESQRKKWYYVGQTKDINIRFERHNRGLERATKPYIPYKLIFVQLVENNVEARDLEKYLKIRWNKEALLDFIMPKWRNWQTHMV